MTHDELQTKVEELEALLKIGNDYALAETQAQELLKDLSTREGLGEVELRSRSLLALSQSLWQRGMAQDALPFTQQALTLAEQAQNKVLQAKAWATLGLLYWKTSNYPHALENYGKALTANEQLGDKSGAAKIMGNIGFIYVNLSDSSRALEYLGKALSAHKELGDKSGIARVTGNIGSVYLSTSDYANALEYYRKALEAHEELGNKSSTATTTGNIGGVYYSLSDYPRALEYLGKALQAHEELGDLSGVARATGNIGNVYLSISDYPRALKYYSEALAAYEELGAKSELAATTGNIGLVYVHLSDYSHALECYGKALTAHEDLGEKREAAHIMGNIGSIYLNLSDYPRALEYLGKALTAQEELGDYRNAAVVTSNIGAVYASEEFESYDAAKAVEYMLKAIAMNEELGSKQYLYESYKAIAEFYEKQKRWEDFAVYFKKFYELEKEVQSEEAKKQAEQLDYERKQSEREKHLAVERAKHEATEQLLHNVLPPSIAQRMVAGESLIAEKLKNVSVLFADIVNFTKLSQRITAEELVEGLDRIFSSFDSLAEKHGLEKIKTIGDAYMVVAGAPEARADHAEAMAEFALDMVEAMKEFTSKTTGEKIQLRIGIHSGEVVAGVIGKKKFAYDLWGDAVNTASRMESHGEAGRIHVSEEFVLALSLNRPADTFSQWEKKGMKAIPRGEVDIKGKGALKTYFLERG